MTSFEIYRIIHFVGLVATFAAIAGVLVHLLNGGSKDDNKARKLMAISHGVGLLLALLGGFGMLAKMGIHWPLPGWVFGKFLIWLALGAFLPMSYKMSARASQLWWVLLALALLGAWLATAKPF